MSKLVADVFFERLIAWGVDTIFGFPGDGIDGLFEGLRRIRINRNSSRSVMRRRLRLQRLVMRNTPDVWASAWQLRARAESTC